MTTSHTWTNDDERLNDRQAAYVLQFFFSISIRGQNNRRVGLGTPTFDHTNPYIQAAADRYFRTGKLRP